MVSNNKPTKKDEKVEDAKGTQVAASLPAFLTNANGDQTKLPMPAELMKGSGRGGEQMTADDFETPALHLLQPQSPQMHENPELRAGMWYNSVTQQAAFKLFVVPLYFVNEWVVFVDRNAGSDVSFCGSFKSEADAKSYINNTDAQEEKIRALKKVIRQSHTHYVMTLNSETGAPEGIAVMHMMRSKIQPSSRWNTQIHSENVAAGNPNGDRFTGVWVLGSQLLNKGQDKYHNATFTFAGWATPELYKRAEREYESIHLSLTGEVNVEASVVDINESKSA